MTHNPHQDFMRRVKHAKGFHGIPNNNDIEIIEGSNIGRPLPTWRDVKSQIKPNKARQTLERAYHETGHAVIARILGIDVKNVTIVESAGNLGSVQTSSAWHLARDADQASQLVAISKDVMISFAGPHAQRRYRLAKALVTRLTLNQNELDELIRAAK
jgi:hypothetical protein